MAPKGTVIVSTLIGRAPRRNYVEVLLGLGDTLFIRAGLAWDPSKELESLRLCAVYLLDDTIGLGLGPDYRAELSCFAEILPLLISVTLINNMSPR